MYARSVTILLCVILAWAATACSTVQVRTHPVKARVYVDGKDVSQTHEFTEKPGFRAHEIVVKKKGYQTVTLTAPRDHMVGWLRWTSLAASLVLGSGCAATGCLAGWTCCNTHMIPSLVGALVGSIIGLNTLDGGVLGAFVVNVEAPAWTTVPGMALGTLLCGAPALGLLALPLLYPRADDVDVRLEKVGAAPEGGDGVEDGS
ncbi:MAG: PEGA domain-containing protein [Deltaproteobacteria bacterium]|nr:PEGA domain-containing protein [Deltaproteobacteria bacterium]